ncbi:MAG: cupin domain-containing protein [Gemmatimonadota bacterium]|nr:cupin domain-containing protein [Gemmatimonadota bacterium]
MGADGGEHRILRGRKPITLKIDPITVGSEHLFLGTELLPPGDSIPTHRHRGEEEALFVHRGAITVRVGERTGTAPAGGTIFIPRNTWVAVRNAGVDTAEFVYVFNEPAFAVCLRGFSTRPGAPYTEPEADSAARIRTACHQDVMTH